MASINLPHETTHEDSFLKQRTCRQVLALMLFPLIQCRLQASRHPTFVQVSVSSNEQRLIFLTACVRLTLEKIRQELLARLHIHHHRCQLSWDQYQQQFKTIIQPISIKIRIFEHARTIGIVSCRNLRPIILSITIGVSFRRIGVIHRRFPHIRNPVAIRILEAKRRGTYRRMDKDGS